MCLTGRLGAHSSLQQKHSLCDDLGSVVGGDEALRVHPLVLAVACGFWQQKKVINNNGEIIVDFVGLRGANFIILKSKKFKNAGF